jgi:alkylhydroperoxidase family enzyme
LSRNSLDSKKEGRKMTRIPLLTDGQINGAARGVIEDIQARGAKVPDLYRMLANAPDLLKAWTDIAWPLRNTTLTSRDLRELLIMRTALLTQAQYEWAHHWELALQAGVSKEKLEALPDWQASDLFDSAERAALKIADELVLTGRVANGAFNELSRHFDASQMVHLILTISFYTCVAHMASAFELDLEPAYSSKPVMPPRPQADI